MCPFRCICLIPCVSGFWAYFCACLPLCVWGLVFCGGVSLCQSLCEAPNRPSMQLVLVTLEHECMHLWAWSPEGAQGRGSPAVGEEMSWHFFLEVGSAEKMGTIKVSVGLHLLPANRQPPWSRPGHLARQPVLRKGAGSSCLLSLSHAGDPISLMET